MAAAPQEGWMAECVRTGYQSFLDGWQTASTMLQEHVEKVDILNPTLGCTCKRACDNGQLMMPVVVADDEVEYPYPTNQAAGGPSPFSRDWGRIASTNPMPQSQITTATWVDASPQPQNSDASCAQVISMETTTETTMAQFWVEEARNKDAQEDAQEEVGYHPPVDYIGNFGYYAEYVPVPRPPSSIASTAVTAVRAAPWERWTKPGKSQDETSQTGSQISKGGVTTSQAASVLQPGKSQAAACQTGDSLISKGAVGTSQAAAALRNLQPSPKLPAQEPVAVPSMELGNFLESDSGSQILQEEAARFAAKQAPQGDSKQMLQPVQEVEPPVQTAGLQPPAARAKAKSHMTKSVLSQSIGLKSSAAMALSFHPEFQGKSVLSQATPQKSPAATALSQAVEPPKRSTSKPPRTDNEVSDRKSALSTMTPMTSSAAMALGGLSKGSAKRHGSNERSCTESVLPGASPTTSIPAKPTLAPASVVDDAPKSAKLATRNNGSRSRGADAKSVISNLNGSSSSASALLGPMLQGQPKRRSARPEGADVASVV